MVLYAAGCVASCGSGVAGKGVPDHMVLTNHVGQMHTLPNLVCSAWNRPMTWSVSPLRGKTTDWRAGCGRSARTVRREEGTKPIVPSYPYYTFLSAAKTWMAGTKAGHDAERVFQCAGNCALNLTMPSSSH